MGAVEPTLPPAATPILARLRAWNGEGELELPDDPPLAEGVLRFAGGALDGFGATEGEALEAQVAAVERALEAALLAHDEASRQGLLEALAGSRALILADELVPRVEKHVPAQGEAIAELARWVIVHARDREALKLGAVILGVAGAPRDVPLLEEVARHDEFTVYAAEAVSALLEDPRDAWWRMARSVSGWGKVQVVQRLAPAVGDRDDIRQWLLREGCANEVMPEYLALPCAVHGRLVEALAQEPVDEGLLEGAVLIAEALLNGGPAEDVDDFDQGARLMRRLTGVLEPRCDSLRRLSFFWNLRHWLEWPHAESGQELLWEERARRGFTRALRAELAWACDRVKARPEWRERVLAAARDDATRYSAWAMAEWVGVDLWEVGFAQLGARCLDDFLWYQLLQTSDPDRFARVVRHAETVLPLEQIASGPSHALGFGPEYAPHACLGFLLQQMAKGPASSDALVAAALRSPVVRNRHGAIAVLEATSAAGWGARTREALARTLQDEPREDVKERLRKLAVPTLA